MDFDAGFLIDIVIQEGLHGKNCTVRRRGRTLVSVKWTSERRNQLSDRYNDNFVTKSIILLYLHL